MANRSNIRPSSSTFSSGLPPIPRPSPPPHPRPSPPPPPPLPPPSVPSNPSLVDSAPSIVSSRRSFSYTYTYEERTCLGLPASFVLPFCCYGLVVAVVVGLVFALLYGYWKFFSCRYGISNAMVVQHDDNGNEVTDISTIALSTCLGRSTRTGTIG